MEQIDPMSRFFVEEQTNEGCEFFIFLDCTKIKQPYF